MMCTARIYCFHIYIFFYSGRVNRGSQECLFSKENPGKSSFNLLKTLENDFGIYQQANKKKEENLRARLHFHFYYINIRIRLRSLVFFLAFFERLWSCRLCEKRRNGRKRRKKRRIGCQEKCMRCCDI